MEPPLNLKSLGPPPEAASNTGTAQSAGIGILPLPYGGYSDTYGVLGGTGLAAYEESSQTRLVTSLLTNFNDYFRYKARFDWRRPDQWIFDVTASAGNDIEDYFGEGDNTPTTFQAFNSTLDQVTASFQYQAESGLYLGPYLEYLYRSWQGGVDLPAPLQNESEWCLGLQSTWEGRDDIVEPHDGFYYQAGFYTLPSAGQSGFGTGVWQAQGDVRLYRTILEDVVLACRVNGAWSLGDPSYSFVYSLGGSNELRGYHTNRFRGSRFYAVQAEARIPVWDWLNGSASLDAGDVTNGAFSLPLASFQVGLRSDLLKAVGLVLRLDWGFGKDENEISFGSSEPF